jgi:hypothetical protein
VTPELAWVIVAGAAVVFAAAQTLTARRQGALIELQVLHELSTQWENLRAEWTGLLMLGGQYYVEPSPEAMAKYPILASRDMSQYVAAAHNDKLDRRIAGPIAALESFWTEDPQHQPLACPACVNGTVAHPSADDEGCYEPEMEDADDFVDDPLSWPKALAWPAEMYRTPLELLALISSYVLQGRVGPRVVYDVLGAELIRNSASLRYAVDVSPIVTYYLGSYPGVRRRVLMLLDLMWAEAAARGDLAPLEAQTARSTKREFGSGDRNRRRLRREARRIGSGLVRTARLDWHLTAAEVDPDAARVARAGQRLRIWLLGLYFSGAPADFPRYDMWRPYDFGSS